MISFTVESMKSLYTTKSYHNIVDRYLRKPTHVLKTKLNRNSCIIMAYEFHQIDLTHSLSYFSQFSRACSLYHRNI